MALNNSPTIRTGSKSPVDPKPYSLIHNVSKLLLSRVIIRADEIFTGLERERNFPGMLFWRSCLNPGLLKYLVVASRSGPAISGVWNSNFPPQCIMLLLTLYMNLPILRDPIQMVRCVTGDLVCDKYGITCHPGEVCRLVRHFWLLVTASHTHSLVQPDNLPSCLQRLRTVVTNELILCFHIVDLFLRKTSMLARAYYRNVRQLSLYPPFERSEPFIQRACNDPQCTWYS